MAKTFFNLPGYYEGLKARRLAQSGRLWLVKIINDPPPYWLVWIRGFDQQKDKKSGGTSIGVWRFQREEEAQEKFKELLPVYPAPAPRIPSEKQLEAQRAFTERRKSSMKLRETSSSAPV